MAHTSPEGQGLIKHVTRAAPENVHMASIRAVVDVNFLLKTRLVIDPEQ